MIAAMTPMGRSGPWACCWWLLGGLWTLQGVGVVGGSFMTGSRLWLVIGLVLVVAGVALLLRLRRRPRGVR